MVKSQPFYYTYTELRLLLLTLDLKSEQFTNRLQTQQKILRVFEGQKYITLKLILFHCKRNRTELYKQPFVPCFQSRLIMILPPCEIYWIRWPFRTS